MKVLVALRYVALRLIRGGISRLWHARGGEWHVSCVYICVCACVCVRGHVLRHVCIQFRFNRVLAVG